MTLDTNHANRVHGASGPIPPRLHRKPHPASTRLEPEEAQLLRGSTLSALAIVSLLVATSVLAETASTQTRVVQRLVATPTPLGPVTVLSDQAAWRVDVPDGAVVLVDAQAGPNSPFYLRAHKLGSPEPAPGFPATRQSALLSLPGAWRVAVDPAAGLAVEIRLVFRGTVSDVDGAPAPFLLTDLERATGCVVPGVCLP